MKIIIVTCDAFQHVVPLCVKYLRKSMDNQVPWDIDVVTNHESVLMRQLWEQGSVTYVYSTGNDQGWSNNMIKYLRSYDTLSKNEPFLLLLEDYIIHKADLSVLNECVSTIETYDDVGMVRLVPIPGPTLPWNDHRGQHKKIGRLDKTTHTSYCMSLQAALWKPRTLLETLEPDQNPWKTEGRGSRRIARGMICQNTQFLCTYKPTLKYKNLLRRGKPDSDVMAWLDRQGEDTDAIRRRT